MFLAKFFDNFITEYETQSLLDLCLTTDKWRKIDNSVWNDRTINFYTITDDPKLKSIFTDILKKIQLLIKTEYGIDAIYADTIDICRWFPESNQPPHCDDMSGTDDHKHHKHRDFGSVIYLNNDYSGGETYYPDRDYSIIPKPGRLAIHPSDCYHKHGVTTIKNGIRYTIASFWTSKINKALSGVDW